MLAIVDGRKFAVLPFFFVTLFLPLLFLLGCGGGGGDLIAITPQQQEFTDVLRAFAEAVSKKDLEAASKLIDTRLIYNKTGRYEDFKERLENFINAHSSISFVINGEIGVRFLDPNEESAELLADIEVTYDSAVLTERIQVEMKKSSSLLGITGFQRYSSQVSAFPPN